ncbi:uncharacterized protein LOC127104378 [Lathyrus oleraceus]|uniref:uncharacterized protein LOC127104378 n=1 Tax=Pisum sativum TaxID=3888 RepID=UPI0021D3706D|nr:uncharacterized protein LOC127104378 [Pisum sativum]
MYLTVLEGSMGCVLGEHDETGRKEHVIYYLRKKFTDCKSRYSMLEKGFCVLAWAAKRLRQYMLTHVILLISKMDPIKYIFEKSAINDKVAQWKMALTKYNIQHVTQKAMKRSVTSDYLAQQPLEDYQSMRFELLDEDIMLIRDCNIPGLEEGLEPGSRWNLVFDGAFNAQEYEACIFGIEAAIDLRIKIIEVYRDSALVKWKNEATSFHLIYLDEPAYCLAAEDEADGYPWF